MSIELKKIKSSLGEISLTRYCVGLKRHALQIGQKRGDSMYNYIVLSEKDIKTLKKRFKNWKKA